jgi:hypothetical protein
MRKKRTQREDDSQLTAEQNVENRKLELIAERQKELDQIFDRHDNLVCSSSGHSRGAHLTELYM